MLSKTPPPSPGDATQIAPSASAQIPSGAAPSGNAAQTRRLISSDSADMSKAVRQPLKVSATTKTDSLLSNVIPLAKSKSSAAACTDPSESTRAKVPGITGSPLERSKPKFPTQALPCESTNMSLIRRSAIVDRSA